MEITKKDIPRLNYILSQDGVYEHIIDDSVPRDLRWNLGTLLSKTDAFIVMPNNQCVLMARELEDEKDCYEVHVAFTKKCRGLKAKQATIKAINYFIEAHPNARKMVALIPVCNRVAIIYAVHAGFKRTEVIEDSFTRDTKRYDQVKLEYYIKEE
jgi:hypothetical protein